MNVEHVNTKKIFPMPNLNTKHELWCSSMISSRCIIIQCCSIQIMNVYVCNGKNIFMR